ncbi:MAG: hypothetical protein ABIF87_01310 [Pseudomonadota bacterium]
MKKKIVFMSVTSLILGLLLSPMLQADINDGCVERLKDLGRKCLRYAEKHNGRMPGSLSELYYRAYINDLDSFICPENPTEIEHRTEIDGKAAYILSPEASGAGLRPVVQDRSADNHGGKGIYVFYSDGSLRWKPSETVATATPEPIDTTLDNVKGTGLSDEDSGTAELVTADMPDLAQASEAWAREWKVLSTAKNFAGGGRPGFYAKAVRIGDAIPNPGRKGVLYLHPTTQQEPARIARRVTLTGPKPTLKMGVSGNWNLGADWVLLIKINGQPLAREKMIAGMQGWQDLTFDLSAFSGQTVFIEIEARANNWFYEYAFFDYISID